MSSAENLEGHEHIGDEYVTLTIDAGRGDLGQIIPPFLPVQRKRKRCIGKQREGQSMRRSMRHRE
jgi:hypothetical protein